MEELKKRMFNIACDLSLAMKEWEKGDADCMDNACCRVQSLIYELQELYPKLCEKADNVRNGRA